MSNITPPKEIQLLRCGGCQASVVWDTLQARRSQQSNADRLSNDASQSDVVPRPIVWDDSENGTIHPTLQNLERVKSLSELSELIASIVASDSTEGDHKTTVLAIHVFICHGNPSVRRNLAEISRNTLEPFEKFGICFSFPTVIHPSAYISPSAVLGQGCFIGPGAVIHTNANIGEFCIINTLSVVEHDCVIGDFCNANPGAIICGAVTVAADSIIGANAAVRDHVSIAQGNTVGMQAGVITTISAPGQVSVGLPCRKMLSKEEIPSSFQNGQSSDASKNQTDSTSFTDKTVSNTTKLSWCFIKKYDQDRCYKYLLPSLTKGHLANDGPLQRVAVEKLKKFCGSERAVLMTANGTAALHVLASAWEMKLNRRLKWVTQAFTFPSSIQGPFCDAIVLDMDKTLLGPSMQQLQNIVDSFDGIVVTNVFGQPADCIAYERWCKQNGKILLLDNAATAIHFTSDGRSIHDVGDGAFVSLHETKPLGRGEGGAIFIPSFLYLYAHRAMNFGFNIYSNERIPHRYASNARMSDFAAAAICDHIDHIMADAWLEKHQILATFAIDEIATKFQGLEFFSNITFPALLPCLFLVIPSATCDLDLVATYLHRCIPSIEAKRYYRPLSSPEEAPDAWNLYRKSICLPFHVGMTKELISYQLNELHHAIKIVFA
jgi:sugar O-acyltransferase (sialic acid O-acetyltransferase NeuD family)